MKQTVPWMLLMTLASGACGGTGPAPGHVASPRSGSKSTTEPSGADEGPAGPRLGVSWPAFTAGDYDAPHDHLTRVRELGFEVVSLVPTYTYEGLDRIDHEDTPSFDALAAAMTTALDLGLGLVVKPHLDPPRYRPGFDARLTTNHSWRAQCPWRGYFDIDPMSEAYLHGLMVPTLEAIARALDRVGGPMTQPVRLELGSELMNATVHRPQRWFELVARMREEIQSRDLEGRVHLSHNFSHHIQLPEDFVLRMEPAGRRALARYIEALDALALSQYMDLTVAMPAEARGTRLPTRREVADALLRHERTFRSDILDAHLGLPPERTPPLHIGEFGVGVGGLSHPNVWQGELDDEALAALQREVTRGHEGLLAYLADDRTDVRSAVLWVTGGTYDVFGWMHERNGIPDVMERYRSFRGTTAAR